MTTRAFTTAVLFTAVAGGGWITGVGMRARSAVTEIAAPAWSGASAAEASGIRLGGPARAGAAGEGGPAVPVLRIFGDYECRACRTLERKAGDSLRALADAGLIAFDYHHRPLSSHPRGRLAAELAYCGAGAGQAAAVHDALGRSVDRWAAAPEPMNAMLDALAATGPARGVLEACVSEGRMVEAVDADRQLAEELAVAAVPTVFLDAMRIEFRSYEALLAHVTRRAARRRSKPGRSVPR